MLGRNAAPGADIGPRGGDPDGGRRPARVPRRALLAAFHCLHTERLGRLLGFPVAVIAVTSDPQAHAGHLERTWHGAWTPCEGWCVPFDNGLTDPSEVAYAHWRFDPRWLGGAEPPAGVVLADGCLAVGLPRGFAASDLGALFRLAMTERRLEAVASRPSSVRRRFASGRPLVAGPRYALSGPVAGVSVSLAQDLYAFRPRDLPAVAAAAAMAANGLSLRSVLADRRSGAR